MLPDDAPPEWNAPFLNLVAECRTDDPPDALLDRLKAIERELGRGDRGRWAPREIDLDILLWGNEQIATERLRVPHPGITERAFVLTPLAALEPLLTIPGRGHKTVLEWSRLPGRHIPLWMGIVNVTPDSFSDGGRFVDWPAVDAHVDALHAGGARARRRRRRVHTAKRDAARRGARNGRASSPCSRPLLDKHAARPLRPRFSVIPITPRPRAARSRSAWT